MGRVPIAAGWVRDEEENILMKCVWQRGYRRPDGAEVLQTVWLCEGNGGFSVRVEEADAERTTACSLAYPPDPRKACCGMTSCRVARLVRSIEEVVSGHVGMDHPSWVSSFSTFASGL
jgi:hypothetical protein